MRVLILSWVAGIVLLQSRADLPGWHVLAVLCLCAMGLALLARRSAVAGPRLMLLAGCGAAVGFAWAAVLAHGRLVQELPAEWEGRDVVLVGVVDSLPYRFPQGMRFNFAVERVEGEAAGAGIPTRLALSWYGGFRFGQVEAAPDARPGERWRLTVRLKRPHGNANEFGFDYEAWLLEQNLRATGYVRANRAAAVPNQRLDNFVYSPGSMVERARAGLRDRIHAALGERAYSAVIVALVIGDQRGLDQDDWKVFNRTGIGHLISISGLHITMIAGLFAGLVHWLWRHSFFTSAQLPLLLPAQKAAALAGAVAALGYVLLAGFGVPAQRTLYMLSVVAIALWTGRLASVGHVLCLALLAVTLLDPWAVLWPGFWLSFSAVGVILFAGVGRLGNEMAAASRWSALRQTLSAASRTQYAVTVGLVPLTMLLFGQVSLVSPLANAVAIPLVGLGVTPLALAGSVLPDPLGAWCLLLAHQLITWLAALLTWLSALPLAVWNAPLPTWWMFALALFGTLWLLAPRGWPLRWLGCVTWLPLLLNTPQRPQEGEFWLTAFDVGQGNALLIETRHHRLLYDTGPAYSPEADGGNRVILPYLRGRGIRHLDAMIVSHSDIDHAGGALSVLDEIAVGEMSSSLPEQSAIVLAAPAHRRCEAGQSWTWDGVRFDMLHPSPESYATAKLKPNHRSCTLKVTLGKHSVMLAGDIEAAQERQLLEQQPEALQATVLLAPHHGSGTSSTPAFLRAVQPEIAIFQVGYRNRYRHPKAEVFERYQSLGIRRLRSDDSGAIRFVFGERMHVEEFRRTHARYWHPKTNPVWSGALPANQLESGVLTP